MGSKRDLNVRPTSRTACNSFVIGDWFSLSYELRSFTGKSSSGVVLKCSARILCVLTSG